jgi:energy-converting hydrogenase B subunit D
MALLFVSMGALDVAFTEATLGAGVSGVLFVIALFVMERRSQD